MKIQPIPNQHVAHATTLAVVRMKTIEAFRIRGLVVHREDATTLTADSGAYFPLDNVFARCSGAPRSAWDDIIGGHVQVMIEAMRESDPAFIAALSDDEFYSKLRERIVAPCVLDSVGAYSYSVPLLAVPDAPRRVLNLSSPNRALTLSDSHFEGRDIDAAWAAGRKNTAAIEFEGTQILEREGICIEVLDGDSIYLASKIADMTTLISTHLGECLYGVLFAVPNAYELAFHRPRDADDAVSAVTALAELADVFSRSTPSPLSRSVFFWRDGEYSQVSDGAAIALTGTFASTVAELRKNAA